MSDQTKAAPSSTATTGETPRTDKLEQRLLGGKDGSRSLSAALEHARKLELQLAEAWKRVDAEIAFNEELIEENRKLCEQEPLYTSPRPETLARTYTCPHCGKESGGPIDAALIALAGKPQNVLHTAVAEPREIQLPAQPAEVGAICPDCQGTGTVKAMTQHLGPDDYEEDVTCPECKGTGSCGPEERKT